MLPARGVGQTAGRSSYALVDVNVIDVAGGVAQPHQTVLVSGGRIEWVGPTGSRRLPRGTVAISARDEYVIPGLWDMHVHLTSVRWAGGLVADSIQQLAFTYFRDLLLSTGITGVRDVGGDLAVIHRVRSRWTSTNALAPRLLITGEKLGAHPVVPGAPFPVTTPADVRRSIAMLQAAGADHVKLALAADLVDDALAECRARQIRCLGHVPGGMPVVEAARLGMASFEHLFLLDQNTATIPSEQFTAWRRERAEPALWQRVLYRLHLRQHPPDPVAEARATHDHAKSMAVFRELARYGTWVTPTLILHDLLTRVAPHDPQSRDPSLMIELPTDGIVAEKRTPAEIDSARVRYQAAETLVREMRDAGTGILAGTDSPLQCVPGYALHQELVLLVKAGLTPAEALRAATINPARYLAADTLGQVRAGNVADLVVLRANPLDNISNVRQIDIVVSRGRLLRRAAIDSLQSEARHALAQIRNGTTVVTD